MFRCVIGAKARDQAVVTISVGTQGSRTRPESEPKLTERTQDRCRRHTATLSFYSEKLPSPVLLS